MRSSTRLRASERASSSGSEPASARSRTRAISGADRTSSTASSIGARQARATARAGKNAARPATSASPARCSPSFDAITAVSLAASALSTAVLNGGQTAKLTGDVAIQINVPTNMM